MALVSQARLRAHLATGDAAATTTAKGAALEEAVDYLFNRFPGLRTVDRNARDVHGVREIDIFVRNDWGRSGMDFLHWFLIIECKNLASAVGYQDVIAFKDLLLTKNCPSGILVASAGVSGEAGKDAWSAIEDAQKQGASIIVLTRADLESVRDTRELRALLERRLLYLTLNGTHESLI
ncbi:restriction endonuclease [Serinicoccus sp. LYQ131]|uniref:restriction endonuclease n=1 Tax=Serinicoccus sp. LYQ131 TaxID=3378797 RepID=UPI0038521F41